MIFYLVVELLHAEISTECLLEPVAVEVLRHGGNNYVVIDPEILVEIELVQIPDVAENSPEVLLRKAADLLDCNLELLEDALRLEEPLLRQLKFDLVDVVPLIAVEGAGGHSDDEFLMEELLVEAALPLAREEGPEDLVYSIFSVGIEAVELEGHEEISALVLEVNFVDPLETLLSEREPLLRHVDPLEPGLLDLFEALIPHHLFQLHEI